MTIALWCVLAAGFLPYVAAMLAKRAPGFDNNHPREWLAKQGGARARANAAQLNAFEAFPFFAAAVIVAHLLRGPQALVDLLAVGFIVARLVFLFLYVTDRATLRSLTWVVGFGAAVAIFVIAAL